MGDVNTGGSSTGLTNPAMQQAGTSLGNLLNTSLAQGVRPVDQTMIAPLSGQTLSGVNALANNPNDPTYSNTVSTLLGQQGQIAQGNFGNDPVRNRLMGDVAQNVNSSFLTDGRFGSMGSGGHSATLANETANALAPYDMQRQQQAIGNVGQLYGMSTAPAMAQLQGGQIMDAYNTSVAQDQARRFDEVYNAPWKTLQTAGSIFSGTAPATGTQTSENLPWWRVGLGLGSSALGFL